MEKTMFVILELCKETKNYRIICASHTYESCFEIFRKVRVAGDNKYLASVTPLAGPETIITDEKQGYKFNIIKNGSIEINGGEFRDDGNGNLIDQNGEIVGKVDYSAGVVFAPDETVILSDPFIHPKINEDLKNEEIKQNELRVEDDGIFISFKDMAIIPVLFEYAKAHYSMGKDASIADAMNILVEKARNVQGE